LKFTEKFLGKKIMYLTVAGMRSESSKFAVSHILAYFVIIVFIAGFSGCSSNSPIDITQEEIDNLSASMDHANSIFLDGTYYWDRGNFSKAREVYGDAATKYREVDYRAREMYSRTQNENLRKWLNLLSLASENLALASEELATASELAFNESKKQNQDINIYMKHIEKAKECSNKAWEYFEESKKLQ